MREQIMMNKTWRPEFNEVRSILNSGMSVV